MILERVNRLVESNAFQAADNLSRRRLTNEIISYRWGGPLIPDIRPMDRQVVMEVRERLGLETWWFYV